MSSQPSALQGLLSQQLLLARQQDQQANQRATAGTTMDVPATGTVVSSAYEQLRNAAEYAEEHLLLQRAVKRFCKRTLFITRQNSDELGRELIVELVQAGYLPNNHYGSHVASAANQVIDTYMRAFGQLRQAHVDHEVAMNWVLACISVEIETMLVPHSGQQAVVFLAYHHFLQALPQQQFSDLPDTDNYELCLYIAVHRALLKSDIDIIRHDLLTLYQKSPADTAEFRAFNEQVDRLCHSELTSRLIRVINRYGAAFRILKAMVNDRPDVPELLQDESRFMDAFQKQVSKEYKQVGRRLNHGLAKSIMFIFITKVLIGIAIEVPYDKLRHGSVALLPLGVNLLFPPLYMASLKLGLKPPSSGNARLVEAYVQKLLYGDADSQIQPFERRQYRVSARALSALLFCVPILVTVLILQRLDFNVVQMVIFFVFFSTASFLGFRLSTVTRELELASRQSGLLLSLRDTFYLPFILVGQWLSRKYSKLNIIARFLDLAIELPLKALLRLIRQWIRFLNEKHDDLY